MIMAAAGGPGATPPGDLAVRRSSGAASGGRSGLLELVNTLDSLISFEFHWHHTILHLEWPFTRLVLG